MAIGWYVFFGETRFPDPIYAGDKREAVALARARYGMGATVQSCADYREQQALDESRERRRRRQEGLT